MTRTAGNTGRWQETGLEELAARISAMGREAVEPFFCHWADCGGMVPEIRAQLSRLTGLDVGCPAIGPRRGAGWQELRDHLAALDMSAAADPDWQVAELFDGDDTHTLMILPASLDAQAALAEMGFVHARWTKAGTGLPDLSAP